MEVSEFLIRQVVNEDIQYFSFKTRKGQFLSPVMKEKRKDRTAKLLNKLDHPLQRFAQSAGAVEYTDCFSAEG